MANMGFNTQALSFMRSYLAGRTQYVGYRGAESYSFPCPSGVPQGSNLGPLFFAIFINDIGEKIKHSNVLLYADDMKIYSRIVHKENCSRLQNDINTITEWSEENRLPFNVKIGTVELWQGIHWPWLPVIARECLAFREADPRSIFKTALLPLFSTSWPSQPLQLDHPCRLTRLAEL